MEFEWVRFVSYPNMVIWLYDIISLYKCLISVLPAALQCSCDNYSYWSRFAGRLQLSEEVVRKVLIGSWYNNQGKVNPIQPGPFCNCSRTGGGQICPPSQNSQDSLYDTYLIHHPEIHIFDDTMQRSSPLVLKTWI